MLDRLADPFRLIRGPRSRRAAATLLALGLLVGLTGQPVSAAGPLPDLAPVVLAPADLPPGFAPSADGAASFTALAHSLAGSLAASPDLGDVNAIVLQRTTDVGLEFVTAVLLAPVSDADQVAFDASVQQADRLVHAAAASLFDDATVVTIAGLPTGVSRVGVAISAPSSGVEYRAVVARRGSVLEVVGHAWTTGVVPVASLEMAAAVLDARLAAAVGPEAAVFRPAGPLVPTLTTHIPSPLDLSVEPAVVGTNLALTAFALLLLTVSSRVATRLLAQHEGAIARRIAIVGALGRAEAWLGSTVGGRVRGRRAKEILAFVLVMLFYGSVFSLLEPGWEPLSLTGLWLLVSFTIANAVVGMADDLVAWRVARHWDVEASLAVRPTSALVAIASVGLSRVTAVVPGLMFGTPDALRIDEAALGEVRARRLAAISVVALMAVGATAWSATIITTGLGRAGELVNLLAGVEALLLLVFASALQNLFVALLGLRGSAGELLRSRSPVSWGVALAVVSFLFFHALLNPQGDPAAAFSNRNVQVVVGLVATFSAVVFSAWGIAWLVGSRTAQATRQRAAPRASSPPGVPWPTASRAASGRLEVVLDTVGGRARGRATFQFTGGWVVARTQLIDPRASRQFRAFGLLSAFASCVPFGVVAFTGAIPAPAGPFVIGCLAIALTWLGAVIVARLGLERYAVTHTAVFPAGAMVAEDVRRDWSLGCALAILLTPLAGILYLVLARGRVVRVIGPFAADQPGPMTLRLKGNEAEARYLAQLVAVARVPG